MTPFYLNLFMLIDSCRADDGLESRIIRFLGSEASTECLDAPEFSQINGSGTKADYLLGNRGLIAELKTLNGDPKDRVEKRLKARFAEPDAPIVFGTLGLGHIVDNMSDRDEILRAVHDLSSRAVRRHLQKANEQIAAIKERLTLPEARGLAIIMNDSEPMIDAANIGFSIKNAFENVAGAYPHIDHIWATVERHRVRLPNGVEGYPQLLISKSTASGPHWEFLKRMLWAWGQFNGGVIEPVSHNGDWDVLRPIFNEGSLTLEIFE